MSRRLAPHVRIDGNGRLLVKSPLTQIAKDEYRGRVITVTFRFFHFDIQIEDEISIPLAPTSFSEAAEVVECVTAQIVEAVDRMALGSYPTPASLFVIDSSRSEPGVAPLVVAP